LTAAKVRTVYGFSLYNMLHILGNGAARESPCWQPEPTTRGTFSILTTCIITLSLCAWSILHLNIPEHGKADQQFWRKMKWLLVNIFAPEVVCP